MLREGGAGTDRGDAEEGEVCSGRELLSAPDLGTLLLDHGALRRDMKKQHIHICAKSKEAEAHASGEPK